MSFSDPSLGSTLDAWLNQLEQAGFKAGVRERLQVQKLLVQLSAAGELSQHPSAESILTLIKPLLCTKPEQQRQYAVLLAQFLAQRRIDQKALPAPIPGDVDLDLKPGKLKPWHAALFLSALLLLLVFIASNMEKWLSSPTDSDQSGNGVIQPIPKPNPETSASLAPVLTFEFAQSPAPVMPEVPEWFAPVRTGLLTIGSVSLLLLLWLIWAHGRRQLYLQNTRTDREVEEHVLTDPNPVSLEPAPAVIRSAARLMRQPYAGQRTALALLATLRATLRARGLLSPRYRTLKQTPEYLVLIDQRHPSDHHSVYSEALVAALMQNGVAIEVFYFEGSPQTGCWRLRNGAQGRERFGLVTFAELAARYTGHRLLVFAEALALVDEVTGLPRSWATSLNAFPQRAWLTPMPLNAWGWAEQVVDEQGFLVLPLQPESLITAAGWFSAGQLGLAVGADWPLSYPSLLRDNALAWVIQRNEPPAAVQEELLFQLRDYLGAQRFQWLCACSIFPAISPAMTLALGRELNSDARSLMLGMAAIGALPWFRYAFMPAWLRLQLIHRLTPSNEAQFRQIIESRLVNALEGGTGTPLLTLSYHKRRLAAWLHRRRGPARDVVLVDFLQYGHQKILAQCLPKMLRKWLFRQGLSVLGFTENVFWVLIFCLFLGFLGLIGKPIYELNIINYHNILPVSRDLTKQQKGEVNAKVETLSNLEKSGPTELEKAKDIVTDFREGINQEVLEGDNISTHSKAIQPQDNFNAVEKASLNGKSYSPISFMKSELKVDDEQENNNVQNDGVSSRIMDPIVKDPKKGLSLLIRSLSFYGNPVLIKERSRWKLDDREKFSIKFGKTTINDSTLERVIEATGAGNIASIFVRNGISDYVRISSTIFNTLGINAYGYGTKLDADSPAFGPAVKGEGYCGQEKIAEYVFDSCYEPIRNGGEAVGLYHFGVKK